MNKEEKNLDKLFTNAENMQRNVNKRNKNIDIISPSSINFFPSMLIISWPPFF